MLFILPSLVLLIALAWIYLVWGDVAVVAGIFYGIKPAVARARAYAPFVRKIEVETETLEQVREAVEAGADIIMLDNMDPETMKEAVALTECSGNVTAEKIAQLRDIGVDYISSGALTHSSPILDLSLKHLRPVEA